MQRTIRSSLILSIGTLAFIYCAPQIGAQTSSNEPATKTVASKSEPQNQEQGGGKVGIGFRASSLGLGGEVAVRVTRTTNVRGGMNFFRYSRGYDQNGIHFDGNLRWFTGEAHFDWFPFSHVMSGFHLSPGLIAYNDNHVNATAAIPGGNSFTLNNVSYVSNPTNPVGGTGTLSFNRVDPTILVGFGNLVPRKKGKHFSVNFEAGVAFQGSPKVGLNLAGSACAPGTSICSSIATNPTIQSNVQGQQTILSNDLSPFRYYPVVSLTFGYRL